MATKKMNALPAPLTPSAELAQIVGPDALSRAETVSKVWAYIKKNNLQNPANKREILADAKLRPVFAGKDKVSMFEMNKHLAAHLRGGAYGGGGGRDDGGGTHGSGGGGGNGSGRGTHGGGGGKNDD